MNPTNPTLIQRFLADTPVFFKKVHIIGLFLVALAISLQSVTIVPPKIDLIAGVAGGVMALVSLFAVKDIAAIQTGASPLDALASLIPDLVTQVGEVKSVITTHDASLKSISDTLSALNAQPVAKPVPATAASPGVITTDPPAAV